MLRILYELSAIFVSSLQFLHTLNVKCAVVVIYFKFLRTLVGLCAIFVNKSNQMHTIYTKWAHAAILWYPQSKKPPSPNIYE